MVSFNNIEKFTSIHQNKQEHSLNTLPLDIINLIFSNLSEEDIQQTSLVSHAWNQVTINTIGHFELHRISRLARFLSKNLQEEIYATQKNELACIANNNPKFTNLNQICALKEKFLNILKDIDTNKLENLNSLCRDQVEPKFLENVFELTRIYKEIDADYIFSKAEEDYRVIKHLVDQLADRGAFKKAVKIINTLSPHSKELLLLYICMRLAARDVFKKAIEIADTINVLTYKDKAIENICFNLKVIRNFDLAAKTALKNSTIDFIINCV